VQYLEHYVVVNSVEYEWLEISDDARHMSTVNKPDLFIGHEAIVTYRPPLNHWENKFCIKPIGVLGMYPRSQQ
jgi:hypothetical protein